MKNHTMWLIAVVAMLFGLSPAKGVVLSDNLSATLANYDYIYYNTSSMSGIPQHWAASSFTTGTNPLSLQSVILSLQAPASGALGGTDAQVQIYTDNSGLPGNPIGSLTSYSPTPIDTARQYTFTDGGILLDPNSIYWIVAQAPTNGNAYDIGTTTDPTGNPGGTFQFTYAVYDPAPGAGWTSIPGLTLIRQVTATVIPEPSAMALFGTALLLFGLGYRRHAGNIA
ncbi:MAG: choice-of-anchor R domain-containing protein [Candidatus Competibacteraceae bacterium]